MKQQKTFVCDFETTVYDGQKFTEVWAAACVEMGTEDVSIFHSIDEQYKFFLSCNCDITAYYHNLKFDGAFWLSYLLINLGYQQAFDQPDPAIAQGEWVKTTDMKNNSFKYLISEMGQWYSITIKAKGNTITILDSLKLLPFSVKKIGNSFNTKHKKLEMEYTGFRYAGCEITDEEKEYIANDVLVVKEALEFMYNEGHKKLTIGSCCLSEYKTLTGTKAYSENFPNLYDIPIDGEKYGDDNAGEYIRRAYRGGWCYLVRGKENQLKRNGTTADVNSLYPSMMSSESGNRYPIGKPTFWKGNFIPDEALRKGTYYFIRIKTRFYIKPNKLPFIQIKSNLLYKSTEMLESSDVYDKKTDAYFPFYYDWDGNIHDTCLIMTMTMTDYALLKEHYELVDFEILDGCYFDSKIGIFDTYIEKYKKIKLESKGAMRELAKLFLNNLYGKMASSTDSSFKVAYVKADKSLGFFEVNAHDKTPGYIACGAAITSYARNFTITAAQKNYYGIDKPGFIYADTDSIHCDLLPSDITGITVHDKNFCCWKLESCWDVATFTRQKTYIEHIIAENLEPVDPYYSVKCAGMPDKCKQLFIRTISNDLYDPERDKELPKPEQEFLKQARTIEDFRVGLKVPGKLLPKRIPGGILLKDTTYEMR